ncbi:hypothetical protein [Bacillus sp. NPDC094106]|uniref:hypothetical protein n=1 Tax=Bacillus sp. NPDC094106 TaxID=3363949 RepID=UPI003806E2F6
MIKIFFDKKEYEGAGRIEPVLSRTMVFRFIEPKINDIILKFFTYVSEEWGFLESREKRHPEYTIKFIQECYLRMMPWFLDEERLESFIVKYEDDFYVLLAQYMIYHYNHRELDFLTEEQQVFFIDIVHKLKMHEGLKLSS